MDSSKEIRLAGLLYLVSMLTGIFSVAPAVDAADYLTAAAGNSFQVIMAAICQLVMSFAYIGIAVLLYPLVRRYGSILSVGFLSFRIIAVCLSIAGTMLLLSVLFLSREYAQNPLQEPILTILGNVLRTSRDHVNHVFMVIVLCTGNCMLYVLFFRSMLIPGWLSVWGMAGSILSVTASMLLLFQKADIATVAYLALNAPTAIQELVLGAWLIVRGFPRSHHYDLQCSRSALH